MTARAVDAPSLTVSSFRWSCFSALHRQLTGTEYDAFVAEFIEAAVDKYGKSVMLQVCLLSTKQDVGCLHSAEANTAMHYWLLGLESAMLVKCCPLLRGLASVGNDALEKTQCAS